MKKLGISLIVAFALSLAAAVAQTGTDPSRANPGASPSASQPSTSPQADPAAGQAGSPAGSMTATGAGASDKAETLQGCVQAQGGQYVLEGKTGKQVALTGQDVSPQVGHEVSLKGTWASGSAGTGVSTASGASSDKSFNVTSVDTLSSTCAGKSSGSAGASPSGSNPAGTGSTSNPPQQ